MRKTALGTERFLTWEREPSRPRRRRPPPPRGCGWSRSSWPRARSRCYEAPVGGDVCLAIGNEDHGCSPALLAACATAAYIPQIGRVGSLNVAVAAAVALADARRREWQRARRALARRGLQ